MGARANKNKGRLGQQEVCKLILDNFEDLEPDDVRSNPMGSDGEDILLSPKARRTLLNTQIEVKRKKKIGACRFMEQSENHGPHKPVAVFREDRGPWYATISLDFLFDLFKRTKGQST